jgi:hypothetical protein
MYYHNTQRVSAQSTINNWVCKLHEFAAVENLNIQYHLDLHKVKCVCNSSLYGNDGVRVLESQIAS